MTIYLDLDPRVGLERARGRGELDRIEKMDMSFFDRTRARYLELAENDDTVVVVNAEQSIEQVAKDIRLVITNWLNT